MNLTEKIGRALGYEECDIQAYRRGEFTKSMNGYCLCADCSEMTDEQIEARLGRSVYAEPTWLRTYEWEIWTDDQWVAQFAKAEALKGSKKAETDGKKQQVVKPKAMVAVG